MAAACASTERAKTLGFEFADASAGFLA